MRKIKYIESAKEKVGVIFDETLTEESGHYYIEIALDIALPERRKIYGLLADDAISNAEKFFDEFRRSK
ncbi:hypothetical protein IWQ54_006461 [Labrenzia sp. EL_195]|nr:hypothetical protein [Labrenzia sp. EL_195]